MILSDLCKWSFQLILLRVPQLDKYGIADTATYSDHKSYVHDLLVAATAAAAIFEQKDYSMSPGVTSRHK